MRVPVPRNRLVAFTLLGALLTAVVAGALAFPGVGLGGAAGPDDGSSGHLASDAPTPNQNFTTSVQTGSGGDREAGEHEEGAEHEGEEEEGRE